jgi:hypothetical protein
VSHIFFANHGAGAVERGAGRPFLVERTLENHSLEELAGLLLNSHAI